ncbi:MAG: tyrosine-type recombinase/integrase [Egibacteraceae bacterium]
MAWITKEPNGRYKVGYRTPDGRIRARRFDRKVDADRFAAAVETDKNRGEWVDPQLGKRTLSQWVDEWWPTIVNLAPSSRERLRGVLDHDVLPRFGKVPIARITHTGVATWVADLQRAGLAPATVHKCHQVLSRVLAAAVRAGLLQRNVTADVELPRIRSQEMRFITPEQITALADAHPERYRVFVLIAAYGGFRFAELAGLRRHRVDLAGRVRVEETCVEVKGTLHWGPPKTDAGRRTVALPPFVVRALREHERQWSQPELSGLVFTAPESGPLRRSNFRHKVWLPAVRAVGLDGLRIHDLRHTAVALWIAAGANLLEVKRRAGHERSSFTMDRYGHLFPNADEDLARRLDELGCQDSPKRPGDNVEDLGA